ncbi:THUMP domain-containing protein [Lacticaseibacillus thailandensis]|uniref:THUMP domain-containing protein n=1 Tax=Lacticaseibacillus thailandensis TaxID=381741 RepID=UPI000A51DBC2
MQFKLMATMAAGLEAVTAKELQRLGYQTRTENGRVYFEGDESDIVRTNVWLRSADRIKIILKQFKVLTFDELFEGVKAIPWADYLPLDAAFPVAGRAVRSKLHSEPDVQAITKKSGSGKYGDHLPPARTSTRNGQQVPAGGIHPEGHRHHYN